MVPARRHEGHGGPEAGGHLPLQHVAALRGGDGRRRGAQACPGADGGHCETALHMSHWPLQWQPEGASGCQKPRPQLGRMARPSLVVGHSRMKGGHFDTVVAEGPCLVECAGIVKGTDVPASAVAHRCAAVTPTRESVDSWPQVPRHLLGARRRRGPAFALWRLWAVLLYWTCNASIGEAAVPGPGVVVGFDDPDAEPWETNAEADVLSASVASDPPDAAPSTVGNSSDASWRVIEADHRLAPPSTDAPRVPTPSDADCALAAANLAFLSAFGVGCASTGTHGIGHQQFVAAMRFHGAASGYFFGTGAEGLGYYLDPLLHPPPPALPVRLCLDALIERCPVAPDGGWVSRARARRRRLPDGKRLEPVARRIAVAHRAAFASPGPISPHTDVGSLARVGVDPSSRLWAFDTVNGSSHASAKSAVLDRTVAHGVVWQEARVIGEEATAARVRELHACRGNRWNAHLTPALRLPSDRGSGGVGIAVTAGVGLVPHCNFVPLAFQHRIGCAWVGGVMRGHSRGLHLLA